MNKYTWLNVCAGLAILGAAMVFVGMWWIVGALCVSIALGEVPQYVWRAVYLLAAGEIQFYITSNIIKRYKP